MADPELPKKGGSALAYSSLASKAASRAVQIKLKNFEENYLTATNLYLSRTGSPEPVFFMEL